MAAKPLFRWHSPEGDRGKEALLAYVENAVVLILIDGNM
jgi:hypothetical protein